MGWFKDDAKKQLEKERKELLQEARKHVETIRATTREELDIEIANRMQNRIIKDIQYQAVSSPSGLVSYSAMIIYDAWAEKQREEKRENLKV